MKTKIIQFIPTVLALTAIGYRYVTRWCTESVLSCYGTWVHQNALTFSKPLYFFALYLLPLFLILIFIPRRFFNSWLKFAAWGIPLAILFIWTTPISSGGLGLLSSLGPTRDDAARLAGIVFSALSLALLAYHYFTTRNRA